MGYANAYTLYELFYMVVRSGVTDGGAGGTNAPWQLRCGLLFRNGPP